MVYGLQVLAVANGQTLAHFSNKRLGCAIKNDSHYIDAGSNPVVSTKFK